MTSIIKADDGVVSGVTGITSNADNSGTLEFQATSGLVNMNNVTGAVTIPKGTTAQRPSSPITGQMRYNTTLSQYEAYNGTEWGYISVNATYSVEVLLVAGGGGGSLNIAGGGAGGAVQETINVTPLTAYTIVIGAGGVADSNASGNGVNSTMTGLTTAIGGGKGSGSAGGAYLAGNGGSGGGGQDTAGYLTGGSGTAGQGNNGGNNPASGASGGGGGGAGAAGASGQNPGLVGGAGGIGINWKSLGTYYAGGGGGAGSSGISAGGLGGGGSGGKSGTSSAVAGSPNTGGGGGGGYATSGASGGSGICIIRYVGSQRGSGGTVTSAGGYTYHTFTTSGSFVA